MDILAIIRKDVELGQSPSLASLDTSLLPRDWQNELLDIFKRGMEGIKFQYITVILAL